MPGLDDSHLPPGGPVWRKALGRWAAASFLLGGSVALAVGLAEYPYVALPAVAGAAGAAIAFLLHPLAVFTIYYGLSLPTSAIELAGIPLSLNQICFLAFFASLARWAWTRRLAMPQGAPLWATVGLAAYYVGSALTGKSLEFGLVATKTTITLLAIALGAASIATSERRARQMSWAIVAPTLLSAFVAAAEAVVRHDIFGYRRDYFRGFFRVNGVSPNSVVFAFTCLFAFPFAVWLARHSRRERGRAAGLASAMFLLVISLATFNRQTLLMAPILVALAAWEFRGRLGRALLVSALAGAALVGPFLAPAALARLKQLKSLQSDWSFRLRQDNLRNSLQIFRHSPWFGCGLGSYPRAWWEVRSLDTFMLQYDWDWDTVEPDMSYVRLLAETGLVGLGLNLAFYGGMSGFLWRRGRRLRALGRRSSAEFASAVLLTWAVFLIASAIQDTSLYLRTWLTFGLTICFARGGAVERWAEE